MIVLGERAAALNGERALPDAVRLAERITAPLMPDALAVEPAGWKEVFHTYAEFENAPPLSFAIKGFLQNDGATMIGGLSGHSKTFMMFSIVKALLAGKGARLWDSFDVMENAVRILYLIPECSLAPFKHRLRLFGIYGCLEPTDANQGSLPGVENALQKSEAVEYKVHEASDKLADVNQALKGEVKKRHVLEGKLAAVKEQGEVDRHAAFHDVLTGLPNRALFYGTWV